MLKPLISKYVHMLPGPQQIDLRTVLNEVVGRISSLIWPIVGVALFVMFVYGGFMWALGSDNAQNVQRAQQILMWAVIGTVVAFLSFAIMNLFSQIMTGGAINFTQFSW